MPILLFKFESFSPEQMSFPCTDDQIRTMNSHVEILSAKEQSFIASAASKIGESDEPKNRNAQKKQNVISGTTQMQKTTGALCDRRGGGAQTKF